MVCDPERLDTESVLRAAHTSSEGRSTRGGPWKPKDLFIITARVPCLTCHASPPFAQKAVLTPYLTGKYSVHTQYSLLGDTSIIAVLELRVTHRVSPRQSSRQPAPRRVSSRHLAPIFLRPTVDSSAYIQMLALRPQLLTKVRGQELQWKKLESRWNMRGADIPMRVKRAATRSACNVYSNCRMR